MTSQHNALNSVFYKRICKTRSI